jgi:ZIP family zinc transporter
MQIVLLTALGVGGATVLGALLGFSFKEMSHKFSDMILSFAAGVMLCAAVLGLIVPSVEMGGKFSVIVCVMGIFSGAAVLNMMDMLVPHLHRLSGSDIEEHSEKSKSINKVLLFVLAIAIHNLPEGIAAGVGFGTGNTSEAITIALGIALQNIPEGMVIIAPMLAVGMSKKKTLLIAMLTGVVEVIGTFLGYFAVAVSSAILPFALSFAGGTMLYVISDEMIPETHHEGARGVTYALLAGFCLMLIMDLYLG